MIRAIFDSRSDSVESMICTRESLNMEIDKSLVLIYSDVNNSSIRGVSILGDNYNEMFSIYGYDAIKIFTDSVLKRVVFVGFLNGEVRFGEFRMLKRDIKKRTIITRKNLGYYTSPIYKEVVSAIGYCY